MNAVRAALYSKLSGDATLTGLLSSPSAIFHQRAPQDAATPFVIFHRQAGTPQWSMSGNPLQNDVWLVKAVDRGRSATKAEDIAARIDALLNDATLTIAGSAHLYLRRESDVSYPEGDGAETYRHEGHTFRIVSDPA